MLEDLAGHFGLKTQVSTESTEFIFEKIAKSTLQW